MRNNKKRRPMARIRKRRICVFCELVVIIVLVIVLVNLVKGLFDVPITIREERLMNNTTNEPSVHVFTMKPEETPVAEAWARYPVSLDDDIQRYVSIKCREADIPSCVVIAMIAVESGFNAGQVTIEPDGSTSYGLMQINRKWHEQRIEKLGVSDLLDPYQNIDVGIDYLKELTSKDKPIEWVLMAYNSGEGNADEQLESGDISVYAQKVIALSEEYLEAVQVTTDEENRLYDIVPV